MRCLHGSISASSVAIYGFSASFSLSSDSASVPPWFSASTSMTSLFVFNAFSSSVSGEYRNSRKYQQHRAYPRGRQSFVKYGEAYADEGLWEGSLYVFDDRMGTTFSNKAVDIADCERCGSKTSNYENCADTECNRLFVLCADCAADHAFCSAKCATSLTTTIIH